MKCMKKERKQDHTSEEKIILGRKSTGFEVLREREKCLGGEETQNCREILKK